MTKGFDITTHNAEAVASVINHLGVGIPMALTLRELVINGIEACQRNEQEPEKAVLIFKDHIYENKLGVYNTGGEVLSEKIIKENLATIGNSGNINHATGQFTLDKNKGIGAKVAYLPQAKLGLEYRSAEANQIWGIKAQMCQDPNRAVYTLPSFSCPVTQELTAFPMHDVFTPQAKPQNTITEVVCMGNHEAEDTWLAFDIACGIRQGHGDGGTGYGIFRYLTHRLWDMPLVETKVAIYRKKTGEFKTWKKVEGLSSFMSNQTKLNGSVEVEANGLKATAHWCVLYSPDEKGYSSNWASTGKTAFAWKGETYSDFNQHALSKKRDLNQCGVVVKWNKVMVIFEFDSDIELNTNAGRTILHHNNIQIDKSMFHEEFRNNMPTELKDWQEENQEKSMKDEDIKKYIAKLLKQNQFGIATSKSSSGVPRPQSVTTPASTSRRGRGSNGTTSPPTPSRVSYVNKLRSMSPPDITFLNEPDAPVVELHCNGTQFELCVNIGSNVFNHRYDNVERRFNGACLAKDSIKHFLKREVASASVMRVFEIYMSRNNDSLEEKKSYWGAKSLESCWTKYNEDVVFKTAEKDHKKAMLLGLSDAA